MPKRMKLNFKGGAETPTSTSNDSDNSIVIVIVLAIIACIFFLVVGGVVYYFFIKDDDDETPASPPAAARTPPNTGRSSSRNTRRSSSRNTERSSSRNTGGSLSENTEESSSQSTPPPEPTCKDTGTCCSCNKNCALKDNPEDRVTDDQCDIHPDAEYDGEKPSDVQEFCNMCFDIVDTGCRKDLSKCNNDDNCRDPVSHGDLWCKAKDGEWLHYIENKIERCSPDNDNIVGDTLLGNLTYGCEWNGVKFKDAYPKVVVNELIDGSDNFTGAYDELKGYCTNNQGEYIFWTKYPTPNSRQCSHYF